MHSLLYSSIMADRWVEGGGQWEGVSKIENIGSLDVCECFSEKHFADN